MPAHPARHERLKVLWIASLSGVALLGARLIYVQVINYPHYSRIAERNRTQIVPKAAPRGRIYDRKGEVIATSRPAFTLIYLPHKTQDESSLTEFAENLARELHKDKDPTLMKLKEALQEDSAITLADNLPLKAMFKLSELKTRYPGVDLSVAARRYYPKGAFAAHLIGHMGRMDKTRWRKLKRLGYRVDSWVGKSGIEGLYEGYLRGNDGEVRMEVDAQGRLKRKLSEAPWRPGGNLVLTLDADIQRTVEAALRSSPSGTGAAVVLNPRNGDVLALASTPDFDPNLFLLPEWDEGRKELKDFPAFNRAISGTYAPGSTFKIIVSAAMLDEGKVHPAERVFCPGSLLIGDRTFKCWRKEGHGRQDWLGGITHSCDVYFYSMGLRAGGGLIEEYSRNFHLGQKTRIGLPGEEAGNLFGPEANGAGEAAWYEGDTANLSIGQGELLVTPLQMAVVIAAVANRGVLWRPRFILKAETPGGEPNAPRRPEEIGRINLKPGTWDLIQKGLISVVNNGTGRRVRVPGLVVAGKTGTTQNPRGKDHAWFVAYAGREGEDPSLAVSVLVEHGGHGSSAAGPIARRAIEAAFKPKNSVSPGTPG